MADCITWSYGLTTQSSGGAEATSLWYLPRSNGTERGHAVQVFLRATMPGEGSEHVSLTAEVCLFLDRAAPLTSHGQLRDLGPYPRGKATG